MSSSISEFKAVAASALKDGQWHHASDLLSPIEKEVSPERAVRFYEGQGGGRAAMSREGGDRRPYDERIRAGRRRCVYLILKALMGSGHVECQDSNLPTEQRRYRLVKSVEEAVKKKPIRPIRSEKPNVSQALFQLLQDVEAVFVNSFPDADLVQKGDVAFHCRALRNIVAVNSERK